MWLVCVVVQLFLVYGALAWVVDDDVFACVYVDVD